MSRRAAIPWLLFLIAVMTLSRTTGAQPPRGVVEIGVSGYVLAPDGSPVSSGTVVAMAALGSTTTSIDGAGRFRLVPTRYGSHQFVVSAPGFVPYRITVLVPDSKSLRLPVIRLAGGAHFRVRLVTPSGEPILTPQLRRRLFDRGGVPLFDGAGDRSADQADND